MPEVIAFQEALKLSRDGESRRRRRFKLPPLANAGRGVIRWQPGEGLTAETSLYLNNTLIAHGDKLISGGQAEVELQTVNELHCYLRGSNGSALTVTVMASARFLYQGSSAQISFDIPEIEFQPGLEPMLMAGPGLRVAEPLSDKAISLQRIDGRSVIAVAVVVEADAPLGPVELALQYQGRTISTGQAMILSPLPVGNGLSEVLTLAEFPASSLNHPQAVAQDLSAQLWIADTGNHVVKRRESDGSLKVVAGDGVKGRVDGPALAARLHSPAGIAVTPDGSITYIADTGNNAIRLLKDGALTTLAGTKGAGFKDGPGEVARFRQPRGLMLDPDDGSLYVADTGNHAIRRIDSGGRVTTLAGNGQPGDLDGPATEARLNHPTGLALAPDKTLYFTEPHRVRALAPDGNVRTIAGSTVPGYRTGQRADARFSNPTGLICSHDRLVVADTGNGLLRELQPDTGLVLTLAGGGDDAGDTSGDRAAFSSPVAVFSVDTETFAFFDSGSNRLREVRPARQLALQLLSPPLPRIVTDADNIAVRGRLNRAGALVQVRVTPETFFNQNLEVSAGPDGFFTVPVSLTPGAINEINLIVNSSATPAGEGVAGEEISRSISVRSQLESGEPVFVKPAEDERLVDENVSVELTLTDGDAAPGGSTVILAGGVPLTAYLSEGRATASFTIGIARDWLNAEGAEVVAFPIAVVSHLLPDAPEGFFSEIAPELLRTPPGAPDFEFISPRDGETVSSNRIDVQLACERTIVSGDVNGVAVGLDGIARGVPLTEKSSRLTAHIQDYRGQTAERSIEVNLSDEVSPKVLIPVPPPPAAAAPGESLTLTGAGLERAETLRVLTTSGPLELPVEPLGAGQIAVALPPDTINCVALLEGADDAEKIALNVKLPAKIEGPSDAPLRDNLPPAYKPTGEEAYTDEELPLRINWLKGATVGALNQLIERFGLRLTGITVRLLSDEEGDETTPDVTTWCGVEMFNFLPALQELDKHPQVYSAFGAATAIENAPFTISYPSTLGNEWQWSPLITPDMQGSLPLDLSNITTWQLQFPRFPAVWNIKARVQKRADALISDSVQDNQPLQHEDVTLEGGRFTVEPLEKPSTNHGLNVSSVFGARHNLSAPNNRGTDGANPLVETNPNPNAPDYRCRIYPGPMKTADPTRGKASVAFKGPWDEIAASVKGSSVRVINCSYGILTLALPSYYFNANFAEYQFSSTSGLVQYLLSAVLDVAGDLITLPTNKKDYSKALDAIFNGKGDRNKSIPKGLLKMRDDQPPDKDKQHRWTNTDTFYMNLSQVLARFVKGQTDQSAAGKMLYDRFKERLDGYVVARHDHVATLPENSKWIPRRLIKEFYIKDFVSLLPATMLQGGIMLVNSAGNFADLVQPGRTGDENDFWWGMGNVPSGLYTNAPGFFKEVVRRPELTALVADNNDRKNLLASADAANLILVAGGIKLDGGSATRWTHPDSVMKNIGSFKGDVYAPSWMIRCAKRPPNQYQIPMRPSPPKGAEDTYESSEGTSYAAPLVSGLLAYLLALDPEKDPQKQGARAKDLRDAVLKARQINLGAGVDQAPALDAYTTARLFLAYPDESRKNDTNYPYRFFDRVMCDVGDGTPHGNNTLGMAMNAGASVEWIAGDDKVNMADFRSFRDAYLQLYLRDVIERNQDGRGRDANVMLLRDLNASGAEPWRDPIADVSVWPRFDFDGDGLLAQLQLYGEEAISQVKDYKKVDLLPGSELAMIGSFWPEKDEDGANDPTLEFVPRSQLIKLLPSCDISITKSQIDRLTKNATAGAKIEFSVTADKGVSYQRTIPPDQFAAWLAQISQDGIFYLTVPLVDASSTDDLMNLQLPDCIRLTATASQGSDSQKFNGRFAPNLAPPNAKIENGTADCLQGRLGGRYPVEFVPADKPSSGGNGAQATITTTLLPGDVHVAIIKVKECIDCTPVVIQFPNPPLGDWYPFYGGGNSGPSVGGAFGGGPPNGCGGFPGFLGFGGSWGSSFGPIPCIITITAVITYQDSDFKITVNVPAPDGTLVALTAALMPDDDGLQVVGPSGSTMSSMNGSQANGSANVSQATSADASAAEDGGAEADGSDGFAAAQSFDFVLRGVKEGIRNYTVKVEGMVRPIGETGPGEKWGPMDLKGQIDVSPPFFLVGLTFTSDYVEDGVPYDMIAAVTNSPQATEIAFNTEMAVSADGADVQNAIQKLGDIAPGETVVADFTLISNRTGPVIGISHRETGRVAVTVNVAGIEAAPPPYPIQGSAGLSYLLARYPELTRAVLALAGGAFADGLAQENKGEMEAAIGVALSLHRAGFRLAAGEDAATVIGDLVLDVQGGATSNEDYDLFRRTSLPGRRVREAAGRALVQAAGESRLPDSAGLFGRLCEALAGSPVILWTASSTDVRLEIVDRGGRSLGAPGPSGLTHDLPYSELYSEAWPNGPVPLAAVANAPDSGELKALPARDVDASVDLTAALPLSDGGLAIANWSGIEIPADAYARVPFDAMADGRTAPALLIESPAGTETISATAFKTLADPPPRAITATLAPARQGGAPFRNLEVRFSEPLQPAEAQNPDNYLIPGYKVLQAFWYGPTRAAFLFLDNPLIGGASLSVNNVRDRRGQSIVPAELMIRGGAAGGSVQGRVLGPDDQPLPGAQVSILGRAYEYFASADEEALFLFERVPVGSFQVIAVDPSTGRRGVAEQKLVFHEEEVFVKVALEGDGIVAGRVLTPEGQAAANAQVQLTGRYPFQVGALADADGYFRLERVPLSRVNVMASDELGRAAFAGGNLQTFGQTLFLQLQLAALPPIRILGRVLAPRGLPLSDAFVRLEGADYSAQVRTDAAGRYLFENLPSGDYTLTARDSSERSVSASVSASSGDQTLDLQLTATGTVTVRVLEPDGRIAAGARTALTATGYVQESTTDSRGLVQFEAVPAGPVDVKAESDGNFGEAADTLVESQTLQVSVGLRPQGFSLPLSLRDFNGFEWSIGTDGVVRPVGAEGPTEGIALGRLRINGETFTGSPVGTTVTPGLEVGMEQEGVGGADLKRRVYVSPLTGFFVRVIDLIENNGPEPLTLNLELSAELPGYVEATDGLKPGGATALFTSQDGPPLGLVWAGADSRSSLTQGFADGRASCLYDSIMLAPGESRAFMHFALSRPSLADAAVAAVALTVPPPETLEALDSALAARLSNFTLPEATGGTSPKNPLLAFGKVEVHAYTADNFVIALPSTEINVHSPLYDRTVQLTGDLSGTAAVTPLPVGEVRASITHPLTRAGGSATGQLQESGGVLALDVKLTDSGTVEGYVRRPNGAGVPQCDVYVNGVRVGNSLAGRFLLRGVPVGQVNLKATERQTGLTGSASGTLVETGGKLSLDVLLPPTGTLKGRLLAADGATPLAQLPVTLAILNADNLGLRDADTDADGFFFFPDVPAGAFTLSASNPDTGAAAASEGQILNDGEQVTINLRLMPVGIVTGRVTGWDARTPVAQARVELIASDGRSFNAIADGLGRYALAGVPGGDFKVRAFPPRGSGSGTAGGTVAADNTRTTTDVRIDQTAPEIELSLQKEGNADDALSFIVKLHFTDAESGVDAASRLVLLNGSNLNGRFSANADGDYQAALLTDNQVIKLGENRLEVFLADVAGNQSSESLEFRIAAARLSLSLLNSDGGQGPADVQVNIYDRLGAHDFFIRSDVTLNTSVPLGDLFVEAFTNQGSPEQTGAYARGRADVDGSVLELEATLKPAGVAVVQLFERDGSTPLPGASVTLQNGAGDPLSIVTADESGQAVFNAVPVGLFKVSAQTEKGSAEVSSNVTRAGEFLQITAIVGGSSGVKGVVRDASGNPIAGAAIQLDTERDRRETTTVADGAFDFMGLRPGDRFQIEARDPNTGLGALAQGFVPGSASTANVTLILQPAGTLTGQLLRFDGAVVAAAEVNLEFRDFRYLMESRLAKSDENGRFTFPFVPVGTSLHLFVSLDDGDYGESLLSLEYANQELNTQLTLIGLAPLTVTVSDGGGQSVQGATVSVRPPHGEPLTGSTDLEGRATFAGVLAGLVGIDAKDPARGLSTNGNARLQPGVASSVNLSLPSAGSIEGSVLQPDGTPLLTGGEALLYSRIQDTFYQIGRQTLDASGTFSFQSVLVSQSPVRCEVRVNQRLRARADNLRLESDKQELPLELTLVGTGTVSGKVQDKDGATVPNLNLKLFSRSEVGGNFNALSDANGNYSIADVPAGPFHLSAVDAGLGQGVELDGRIAADKEQVVLNLRLEPDVVELPFALLDANLTRFEILSGGLLLDSVLLNAPILFLANSEEQLEFTGGLQGIVSDGGRQVSLTQAGLLGLDVKRRIFVAAEGYAARYVEFLFNPTAEPIGVDVGIRVPVNFFRGTYTYIPGGVALTSSGRSPIPTAGGEDPDRWAVLSPAYLFYGGAIPYAVSVWDGPGGRAAATQVVFDTNQSQLVVRWANVTVPPGEQVAFMHCLVRELDFNSNRAAAVRLSGVPPELLAALEPEELSAVLNWRLPSNGQSSLPALPGVQSRTLSGVCRSGDGQTPLAGCTVTVGSENPLFPRTYSTSTDEQGRFSLDDARLTDGPCTLTLVRNAGDFVNNISVRINVAVGASEINEEVTVAGTGSIVGLVAAADGTPITNTLVTGAGNAYTGPDGRFTLAGVPAGLYVLRVEDGSNIVVEAFASVTAGEISEITLAPDPKGTAQVRVTTLDGAPAPGQLVVLYHLEGGFEDYRTTDLNGGCTFDNLLTGRYGARVELSSTGQSAAVVLQVLADQTASANLLLPGTGIVMGRLATPGGSALAGVNVLLVPSGANDPTVESPDGGGSNGS